MKLILASDLSFLLKYGYDLTGISKSEIQIGYVTTASKGARNFSQKVQEVIMPAIKEKGYSLKEIDIVGKSKDELRDFICDPAKLGRKFFNQNFVNLLSRMSTALPLL